MGIPVYFKTLINEYQDDILITEKIDNVEILCLDLNCLIHPCCRNETNEDIMIKKIIDGITKLIDYSNVERLVYIAIDGVAPKGKMKQQKMRRYKSVLENKIWDTNAISPGTYFMKKLNVSLEKYNYKGLDIILDDSDRRGEGEHKILSYLKKNEIYKTVIYGLDADLIMLSLVSQKDNIYLLRERTEYNIEKTENEYIYLEIDKLKEKIINIFEIKDNKYHNVIDDYIFICFLLGNDFINHIPSVQLRYNGYNLLLDCYKELQKEYGGYFYLIDRSNKDLICFTFLKEYFKKLSFYEKNHFQKQQSIRKHQYNRIKNKYYEEFISFQNFIKDKELSINIINDFLFDKNDEKYKEMIDNLPLLTINKEENKLIELKDISYKDKKILCEDYFQSLIWTTHYYFNECIDWRWCTEYNEVLFIRDLYDYINEKDILFLIKNDISYSNKEQLNYILPKESDKVHEYNFHKKDKLLKIDVCFKRYLWECDIEFI